jgi:RimJ/RimL family protein N-acetyltransferase
MKRLMLDHAFRWAKTAWFYVSPGNLRSQRALERIGARQERRDDNPVGSPMPARVVYRIDR